MEKSPLLTAVLCTRKAKFQFRFYLFLKTEPYMLSLICNLGSIITWSKKDGDENQQLPTSFILGIVLDA